MSRIDLWKKAKIRSQKVFFTTFSCQSRPSNRDCTPSFQNPIFRKISNCRLIALLFPFWFTPFLGRFRRRSVVSMRNNFFRTRIRAKHHFVKTFGHGTKHVDRLLCSSEFVTKIILKNVMEIMNVGSKCNFSPRSLCENLQSKGQVNRSTFDCFGFLEKKLT